MERKRRMRMDAYTRMADDIDVAYMVECLEFTVADMACLGDWEGWNK